MIPMKKRKRNVKKVHQIKSGSGKKDKMVILGGLIKYRKIKNLNGNLKVLSLLKTMKKVKTK